MKNISWKILVLVVMVVVAIVLVIKEKHSDKPVPAVTNKPVTAQTYATLDLASIKKATYKDSSNPLLDISGEYPSDIVGSNEMKATIDINIAQFKKDSGLDTMTPTEIKEFGPTTENPYAFSTSYQAYKTSYYLTHRIDTYTDTGGAHGGTAVSTYTYDTNGKRIAFDDMLLNDISLQAFSDLIQKTVKEDPKYQEYDINTEWLADSAGAKPENFKTFVLDGDKLVIIFQQYEIASYAAGIIEVPIPFTQLQGIFKPEFLRQ